MDALFEGVRAADRAILGRAITLVESQRPDHREDAQRLLTRLLPWTGRAMRVGMTGVPGAGKSTLIERLGLMLTGQGRRVAVLAIDPSSSLSGGSILGDKTRMERLSNDPAAFVRPSPSGGELGGVARKTLETLLLCEAAGFDVVIVETVGVGQSETTVGGMVDCFVALMLAGAGDELQGIKRGIMEMVDLVVINKADGTNAAAAERTSREYRSALRYLHHRHEPVWRPEVLTASGASGEGLDKLWERVCAHRDALTSSGRLEALRREQQAGWMWQMIEARLMDAFKGHPGVAAKLDEVAAEVAGGRLPAMAGADALLRAFGL